MSVAFNTKLWFPRQPQIKKEDGAMLAMGKNIGSPTLMHWQTSPFNDPKPNAWRADLKINTSTGFARSVFWWVITQATVWQFVGNGYPDLEQKIWQWKPVLTPAFGIAGKGEILFATVNK